ncbi:MULTISPECIES: hypothetical protein [Streptomyces]|uniref:Uncharacterized protein n=1 Tax=Streptomyces mordarskii TaxID=1226758 RepID=A0ABN1DX64_9ACTN
MGDDETGTAKARLRLLRQEFTTPRAHRDPGPRTAPTSRPPADLGIIDHMAAAVREVIDHTRAVAPTAGPAPTDAAVYDWMQEHTAHLGAEQQTARDAMVIRHSFEHALAAGDADIIRWETCPRCACWGLFWQTPTTRAACANSKCVDAKGRPSVWTLAQLAEHRAAAQTARSRTAT